MALNHGTITDTDPHFIIDPVTRKMTTTSQKIMLVQGDHNSERLTFEVPQTMEGHQMNLTTKVQIHFINIDQMTKEQSKSVTDATDVTTVAATADKDAHVTFSWLIPHTATKYQGPLNFVVRFTCEEDDKMVYTWSTAIYSGISVTDGINNGPAIVEEYHDILKAWENELKANQIVSIVQTTVGEGDEDENVWTATFGDGRTQDLKVKNGSRGPTGLIGSIQTMQGHILKFFVGTHEEYESLIDKDNVFAIITDDTSTATQAVVQALKDGLEDGTITVKKAEQLTEPINNRTEFYPTSPTVDISGRVFGRHGGRFMVIELYKTELPGIPETMTVVAGGFSTRTVNGNYCRSVQHTSSSGGEYTLTFYDENAKNFTPYKIAVIEV